MRRLLIGMMLLILTLPAISAADSCRDHPQSNGCQAGLPAEEYAALLDAMAQHPEPEVEPLPVNTEQVQRYAYWRLNAPNGVQIYNAPNGSPTKSLAPGYHFIAAYSYQPGWIEINPGQWVVDDENAYGVRPSQYTGVFLDPEKLIYPMAWVLVDSYPAAYPGAEADKSAAPLKKYTRVNIFAHVTVDGWEWYLIAPDHWIIQTDVARVKFIERPAEVSGRWVAVDLYEQVLTTYEDDQPVFATLIASGLARFPTREGTFQTQSRVPDAPMRGSEGDGYYRLENVPWAIYFDDKISLHGTYWHDEFGYRQSHGCVNLSISDAYWLYHWTQDGGYDQFWVHVYSSGEYVEG